jgi:pimeloyl-ACP methyl ester carboxylesterase
MPRTLPEGDARVKLAGLRTITPNMASFTYEGHRLAFSEFGGGTRTVVLLHGLLLGQGLHRPLAEALAERGHHVVTLDLLGHGASDRPADMTAYSMTDFGRQTIALLDHLGVGQAAVLGTSLGANTALEAAVLAPERLRGMVIEMPVLDNALLGCALAFTPLMVALTFGAPGARALQRVARAVPTGGSWLLDTVLGPVRQDPEPSAAVLQGLFFGRVAPPKAVRRTIEVPTLVIGHRRDPVHPFSDAGALADELPDARLLEASSLFELRLAPDRLTGEIAAFLDGLWRPAPGRRDRTAA